MIIRLRLQLRPPAISTIRGEYAYGARVTQDVAEAYAAGLLGKQLGLQRSTLTCMSAWSRRVYFAAEETRYWVTGRRELASPALSHFPGGCWSVPEAHL
jgi:hypothetical protein